MCTVSWIHEDGGYQLLSNRDEKLTRRPAIPPRVRERGGIRFIAPADGDHGGTWIGTNEFGLSISLLNGATHSLRVPVESPRSRGLLLHDQINAASAAEVQELVWHADLSPFAPFTLLALEPGAPAAIAEWNGIEKTIVPYGEPFMPLISSSVDSASAARMRRGEFERIAGAAGRVDASVLYSFHESHGAGPNAFSPCMHRPDARTVSFSWVRVNDSEIDFFYSPDAPCRMMPGERRVLPRKY